MSDPVSQAQSALLAGFDDIPFHRYLNLALMERRDGYARLRLTRTDTTPTGIGGSVINDAGELCARGRVLYALRSES